jgi:hypothetical protein
MVARFVAEVGGAVDTERIRVCRYFRYSLTVHSGINGKSIDYENA